ncbi:DoxX family protein [Streptomyces sp. NPDC047072]|uniref:DoxX family protein n=1 Tax=Streptomyces sp. NPDC047072 TaxID=3154809 RepID=UPI0033F12BD1
MTTAHTLTTLLAAAMAAYSGTVVLTRADWIVKALTDYAVPRAWWPYLGAAKLTGAAGLLIGLAVPPIGIAAAIGLVLYFTGAALTVVRARWYTHIPFPLLYAAPAIAALTLT